ncbi:hypothetical protein K438DRAFT_2017989 [Mycena galopus ATCC 62051]|nr:hypothetical protein K438DRAFT_2017989 [Mycena galopus ATCC 62051]
MPSLVRNDGYHQVIPTETTHLISDAAGLSSAGLPDTRAVDRQKLRDRMGTIVRLKEGKMVNVNARVPFILHSTTESSSSTTTSEAHLSAPPTPELTSNFSSALDSTHHPQVLTMTPARMRLRADSRYSSPSGSRSSSRRRTDPVDRHNMYTQHGTERGKQTPSIPSQWLGETESEASGMADAGAEEPESPTSRVAIASPTSMDRDDSNAMSIAFSWSDT